ncbi:MAG TPA: hypothetical protein VG817_01785 [Gemmatimonadales bacterium]|nr:hypothetical protein [Gemmatimonadales bacterium]
MIRHLRPTLALGLLALPLSAVQAQSLFPQASLLGGIEAKQYSFGDDFGLDHIRQVAIPLAVTVPLGKRASFDIGTYYATTSVKGDGIDESISGFTDTQLKLSYVFGTDALVASVAVNLPTGQEKTSSSDFSVGASASSTFLLFPVNTYGTGTSVTPGLAGATTLGDWNVGLAASVRWSAEYQPFDDDDLEDARYKPGVETRIRLGVDRLFGRSRFQVGGTFSTFATDELSGGGFGNGTYDPGNRFLADIGLLTPVSNGTVNLYAWNYHRVSTRDDADETGAGGKENIFSVGAIGSFPLSARASLEPLADARFWSPENGSGTLVGVGTGVKFSLGNSLTLVPAAKVEFGSLKVTDDGDSSSLKGWSFSTLFRYAF